MFNWFEFAARWLVQQTGLAPDVGLGAALMFFVYDTTKIVVLLFIVTFAMTWLGSVFPVERVRTFLLRRNLFGMQYVLAAVFGAITPFCSCSSVPLFIGFVRGGIPLGVTLSFLITSPLVNEVAIAVFVGMFGMYTTVVYVVSGILLGTLGGWFLSLFHLERLLTPWAQEAIQVKSTGHVHDPMKYRLLTVARDAAEVVKSVLPYIVVGIAVGALMHGYVPAGYFEGIMTGSGLWSVPAAVIAGVPLYSNAAGVLPIVQVLVTKGVPLGTAVAFMMAVVGLSIPEGTLLKKVMTMRLVSIYFTTIAILIILSGYIFNVLL